MANLTNSAKLIEEMERKVDSSSLATVATSGSYTDLSNKPTIPTVNDSTITVQKNGADVDSFTTNASAGKTINIQLTKADVGLGNVDNTSDANKPISNATQTALNAKADANNVYTKAEVDSAISSAVSSVYKYKGSVANYASLPTTGLTVGDVYNVEDTGDNYAWTGTAWDKLAGTIDLSAYLTKSEASSTYATKTEVEQGLDNKLNEPTNQTQGTVGQVLKKTANGSEWGDAPATGVISSNNTYEDMVHLSQAEYEALETKDPNTFYSTPDDESGAFEPENTGNTGDKLEKTNTGYQWVDGELVEIREGSSDYSAMQGPAPEGFHVPLITEWKGLYNIMSGLSLATGNNWRINLHMPFAGFRGNSANVDVQGSQGDYWSSSPYGSDYPNKASHISMSSTSVFLTFDSSRSSGQTIRCFKDLYVEPTSSWAVIQGTLGSAGIFWNQTDGIISITDGTTGYTIQDKNLGATTVYNDGDTLSEANCGKYYQRGNNYGFAWTGSVTTSSTQVDASAYGPGNYYSNSTFITTSSPYDWSSVQNDNLWGGVTGIITTTEKYAGDLKINEVPTDGTVGQVLTKTNDGYEFQNMSAGGLPLEFVEKFSLNVTYNGRKNSDKTYDYDIFVIAKSDTDGAIQVVTIVGSNLYPGFYNTTPYGIDSRFIRQGNQWGIQSFYEGTVTCYIYKLSLPN